MSVSTQLTGSSFTKIVSKEKTLQLANSRKENPSLIAKVPLRKQAFRSSVVLVCGHTLCFFGLRSGDDKNSRPDTRTNDMQRNNNNNCYLMPILFLRFCLFTQFSIIHSKYALLIAV